MEPVRVDELKEQETADFDFPINPGTNAETALRFLAANPEFGWPPAKIAERTDINEGSITKTMQRLHDKDLVDRISGRYFVNPEFQEEITGLLGDLHNVAQSQAHPEQNRQMSDQQEDISDPHASEDEVDELLD